MNDNLMVESQQKQTHLTKPSLVSEIERISLQRQNETIEDQIQNYMEKGLKFFTKEDISYNWILQDDNIRLINKPITSNVENLKQEINSRDLTCELKVFLFIINITIAFETNNRRPSSSRKTNRSAKGC